MKDMNVGTDAHQIKFFWFLLALDVFSRCHVNGIQIHVSQHGTDSPSCGTQNLQCKTIDYVIATKTRPQSNLTVLLESAAKKAIIYPVYEAFPLHHDLNVKLQKAEVGHTNPIIIGRYPPLGKKQSYQIHRSSIHIQSVDMRNIVLLKVDDSSSNSSHTVMIRNSSLYLHSGVFFETTGAPNIKADFVECILTCSNTHFEAEPTVWLRSMHVTDDSQLTILNSTLNGGEFQLENFSLISVKGCTVKEIHQNRSLFTISSSRMSIESCVFRDSLIGCSKSLAMANRSMVTVISSSFKNISVHTLFQYEHSHISIVNTTISNIKGEGILFSGRKGGSLTLSSSIIRQSTVHQIAKHRDDVHNTSINFVDTIISANAINRIITATNCILRNTTVTENLIFRGIVVGLSALVENCHFSKNIFEIVIIDSADKITVTNSHFIENQVLIAHRAIISVGDVFYMENCKFVGNIASRILLVRLNKFGDAEHTNVSVRHSAFLENNGSFVVEAKRINMSMSITDVVMSRNRESSSLVSISSATILTLKDINIYKNEVTQDLIRLRNATATIHNVSMSFNVLESCISGTAGTFADVKDMLASYNAATGLGELLYFIDSSISLENITTLFNASQSVNDEKPVVNLFKSTITKSVNITFIIPPSTYSSLVPALQWIIQRTERSFKPTAHIKCADNYNPLSKTTISHDLLEYQMFCKSCGKGTYSAMGGTKTLLSSRNATENILYVISSENEDEIDTTSSVKLMGFETIRELVECKLCPPGAICDGQIRSRGGFHGFKARNGTIEFLGCPAGYCCSEKGRKCTSSTTCDNHRTGRLCGQCKEGFYISYFTNTCVSSSKCTSGNRALFWFLYFLTPILITLLLIFVEDIKKMSKFSFNKIKKFITSQIKLIHRKRIAEVINVVNNQSHGVKDVNNDNGMNAAVTGTVFVVTGTVFVVTVTGSPVTMPAEEPDTNVPESSLTMPTEKLDTNDSESTVSMLTKELDTNDPESTVIMLTKELDTNGPESTVTMPAEEPDTNVHESTLTMPTEKLDTNDLRDNNNQNYTFSGILNIIISFYQIKSLLTIQGSHFFTHFIDSIFSSEIVFKNGSLCPSNTITVFGRELLKGYVSPGIMLLTVASISICSCIIRGNNQNYRRFYIGYYIIIAFCFKNICNLAFTFLNCKTVANTTFLYIAGDTVCYNGWQILNLIFLFTWVIPFPLAVVLGYHLLKKTNSIRLFMICMSCPITAPLFFLFKRLEREQPVMQPMQPDATPSSRTLLKNLNDIFEVPYKDAFVWWESWQLYERLILTGMAVFLINPVTRIFCLAPVLMLFLHLRVYLKPYKPTMWRLFQFDVLSYYCLISHLVFNAFRSIVYVYSLSTHGDLIGDVLVAAEYFEHIISPLWYILGEILIRKLYTKIKYE